MIKTTNEKHVDNLSAVIERENKTNSGAAITEEPKSSNHHTHPPNEVSDIKQTTNTTTNNKKQNNDNYSNNNSNNNNIITNNHMNNNKSEAKHRLQEGNTPTRLPKTQQSDGEFAFDTSSSQKSLTSTSEEQQESNIEEKKITKSTNHHSNRQHITTTNEEKKDPKSPSENHQELKVPDPVHEGGNDQETENAITRQPKSTNHHSDSQQTTITNGEQKAQTSPSKEQLESKVNNASAEFVHEEGNHREAKRNCRCCHCCRCCGIFCC